MPFKKEFIEVERSFFGDKLLIRPDEIRCISGTIGQDAAGQPEVVEGSCTIYLKGDLGFAVNHTADAILEMVEAAQPSLH